MTTDNTHYETHDHPRIAMRFVMVVTLFALLFTLAASMPGRTAHQGAMRDVSDDCQSSWCLSTRQIVTMDEARQMKRYLGDRALLVDIRASVETPTGLMLGSDAQVPFMEPVAASTQGRVAMEPRIDFGPNVDEVLRAARMRRDQPVILMSPSTERAVLAAVSLQQRGYSRIYVTHD